jgi:hypothetical protein
VRPEITRGKLAAVSDAETKIQVGDAVALYSSRYVATPDRESVLGVVNATLIDDELVALAVMVGAVGAVVSNVRGTIAVDSIDSFPAAS